MDIARSSLQCLELVGELCGRSELVAGELLYDNRLPPLLDLALAHFRVRPNCRRRGGGGPKIFKISPKS